MAGGNFWEDTVRESAAALDGTVKAIADMVRGGKQPPFSVRLDPQQKRDYWLSLNEQERRQKLAAMDPQAQERLWREIGGE